MIVSVSVSVSVVMVPTAQQPGAHQIDQEPHHPDHDGLVVMDGAGGEQPVHRLVQHQRSHQGQQHGTGKTAQDFDLPGAKRKPLTARQPPGPDIGQHRQAQRQGVRAHVPPVRDQGHRVIDPAPHDLHHHHAGRQHHRPGGVALCQRIAFVEMVRVLPPMGCDGVLHERRAQKLIAQIYPPPVFS